MGGCLSAKGHKADIAVERELTGDPETGEPETGEQQPVLPLVSQRGTPFAALLEEGHMAVVRATYFDDCLCRGMPFQDRANIPAEAIINGEEVVELWEEFGYGFLVIVSCPWLSKDHPDPDCYHLPRLVRALKVFRAYHDEETWKGEKQNRACTLGGGVILDFCCFWQGTRTAEQNEKFKEGLKLISIAYGHPDVTAVKLTSTPPSEVRRYDDRGWTLFESAVIDGKAPSARHAWGERNILTCDDTFQPEGDAHRDELKNLSTAVRKPPLTPLRFREELQVRRQRAEAKGKDLFINSADNSIILDRYDESFAELCRSTRLDFTNMGWGAAEAKDLALALPSFCALKELFLSRNRLDSEAVETLAAAMPHCTALEQLFLEDNNLDASGQALGALAAAVPRCTALKVLWLQENNLGESGEEALRSAWRAAGKDEEGLAF